MDRVRGLRFENSVRKDLEKKGWIVDRWSNNVDMIEVNDLTVFKNPEAWEKVQWINKHFGIIGKLIPAKSRFGLRTTGFPDFIAFRKWKDTDNKKIEFLAPITKTNLKKNIFKSINVYAIFGVECKSNGYLDKIEKQKCRWLLENNIFSKILIAKKDKNKIKYIEFK
ncbi:MAG: hypothetical protein ACTSR3_05800 [Candidatus Helarchaeota archaeon]